MNQVVLLGRLTRDVDLRYTQSQTAHARFTLAIDRGKDRNGNDLGTDFPSCIAWGKTAENIEKYFHKGDRILVMGKYQTGSYEKDGERVYTSDVLVERWEFIEMKNSDAAPAQVDGFARLGEDEVPF